MSKKTTTTAPVAVATATKARSTAKKAADEPACSIAIPIATPEPGNSPKQVTSRLTRRQSAALKALHTAIYGVEEVEVYNARGRQPVNGFDNVVRWLLDRYADEWEESRDAKLVDLEDLVF